MNIEVRFTESAANSLEYHKYTMCYEIFSEEQDPEGDLGWDFIGVMQGVILYADKNDPDKRPEDTIFSCSVPAGITEDGLNKEFFERIPSLEGTYMLINI